MTELFCLFCGIRTKDNVYGKDGLEFFVECPQCNMRVQVLLMKKPTKSFTEVQKEFIQTELTDSQRGTKKRFSSVKSK